jgi:hypothetical protein
VRLWQGLSVLDLCLFVAHCIEIRMSAFAPLLGDNLSRDRPRRSMPDMPDTKEPVIRDGLRSRERRRRGRRSHQIMLHTMRAISALELVCGFWYAMRLSHRRYLAHPVDIARDRCDLTAIPGRPCATL